MSVHLLLVNVYSAGMEVFGYMNKLVISALLVFVSVLCISQSAEAQTVTTVQALNFGEWLSLNNNAEYEITINTDGSYSSDGAGFIEISAPQEGIYDIEDGFTPSTPVASVVVSQQAVLTFGGGVFQMDAFQETHSATVDGGGVVRVTVGGTANTSGNSTAYVDGTYNGTLQIQINF
jgi:hypothetical protein